MRNLSLSTAVLSAFALIFGLIATPAGDAVAQKRGGKLVYMIPASGAPTLDAHRETTFATVHPTAPFYSLLIQTDPTSKGGKDLIGDIAESWTVSKDELTYTFKLRKGVKFHDGTTLNADDVVATWKKIIFPPEGVLSVRKAFFPMVQSVDKLDDYTVQFKLSFPSPAFILAVAMPFNHIFSKDILDKDMHWYEKDIMGSGPFVKTDWVPGQGVKGKRNDNFYVKGQPYLDEIEGIFAPKQNVYVAAIRSGNAHSMFRGLPPAAVDELQKARRDVVVQDSTWNCSLIVTPNPYRKPFDDVRVRRALNLALDRWGGSKYLSKIGIVKTVGGYVFPGSDLAPSDEQLQTLEGYWPDIEKSRAKARELLKEAGVPKGFKFVLSNRNTDQPYKVVGNWALDMWRKVGLDPSMDTIPTAQFWKRLRGPKGGEFDVTLDFNCQAIVNPTLDVSKFTTKSSANYGDWVDEKMDELYLAQMQEPNKAKQKEILWQFMKRGTEQGHNFITLWWHRNVVHLASMKQWEVTPSHYLNMTFANVWLDQ